MEDRRLKSGKYTADDLKQWSSKGGKKKTRGYFGMLKDQDPEKLKQISAAALKKKNAKKT